MELNTEFSTDIISDFFVNFLIPRNPLSCCNAIVIAAPPMNPTIAACDRKSIKKPSLLIRVYGEIPHYYNLTGAKKGFQMSL